MEEQFYTLKKAVIDYAKNLEKKPQYVTFLSKSPFYLNQNITYDIRKKREVYAIQLNICTSNFHALTQSGRTAHIIQIPPEYLHHITNVMTNYCNAKGIKYTK